MVGEVDEIQQESDGAGEGWQCKQGPNLNPSRMKIVAVPCETVGGRCEKNRTGYEKMCVTCELEERKVEESYYGKNGYTRVGELWKMKRMLC